MTDLALVDIDVARLLRRCRLAGALLRGSGNKGDEETAEKLGALVAQEWPSSC